MLRMLALLLLLAPAGAFGLPTLYMERVLTVPRGHTLAQALVRGGFSTAQAQQLVDALPAPARTPKAGTELAVSYVERGAYDIGEAKIVFRPLPTQEATLKLHDGARVVAKLVEKPLVRSHAVAVGKIRGSLWEDATDAGLPAQLVKPFVDLFAWDVDFTREIQPGDTFKVMFEQTRDDRGNLVKTGRILGAELYAKGNRRTAFYFETAGRGEYFNEKGETKRKLLLRTPLEVFRISSGFGLRHHPVLGYTKMHKGTDFAAPTGTPVKASGDGVIAEMGPKGAYGNFILVRHAQGFSTAYAHLHRFGKGLRVGSRVQQGQIIAQVGTTGRSTGPHLHYEVRQHNAQVNPMSTKLPTGVRLAGRDRTQFLARVNEAQVAWNKASKTVELAQR